jgi:PAS domain S-box-containing protein
MIAGAWLPAGILLLLGVCAFWLWQSELRSRRRLRRLIEQASQLAGDAQVRPDALRNPLGTLSALQPRLMDELAQEKALLRDAARDRARAEESLRESEERYSLAVSGANDGMWEWNLNTGAAQFSPRWKSMLGYGDAEIGERVDEWHSRIHPDDRERALAELHLHIDGRTPRFEYEHRLRHKDGTWRWVLARAAAVRHASGRAYRLVGLNSDISARKQAQQVLLELANGMDRLRNDDAFGLLVQKFAAVLNTREAFLCECCDYPATRVRMLAYWYAGQFAPCEEFDLAGTPCQEVIVSARPLFVPRGVAERWPGEREWGTESYLGLPCIDTKGFVIGHLACKDGSEVRGELPHDAVLKLFAVRASVEMERRLLERQPPGERPEPPDAPSSMLH